MGADLNVKIAIFVHHTLKIKMYDEKNMYDILHPRNLASV